MKKYYIGFLVLALLVLGATIFSVVQAAGSKQDITTDKKAQDIADKLNTYIDRNNQIPGSLSEIGVTDVPSTISYTPKGTSYEFCVTYKAAKSYGSTSSVGDLIWNSALTGSSNLDTSSTYPDYSSTYTPSSLYLSSYDHKKGKNCQTIKPYLSSSYNDYSTSYTPALSTSGSIQSQARDTERQTDLRALQSQLEAYFAENGYYPALADLNSATWRATNMKGLDKESFKDPSGSDYELTGAPVKNHYSYQATNDTGAVCTVSSQCQAYTLTAMLENSSGDYTLKSLN